MTTRHRGAPVGSIRRRLDGSHRRRRADRQEAVPARFAGDLRRDPAAGHRVSRAAGVLARPAGHAELVDGLRRHLRAGHPVPGARRRGVRRDRRVRPGHVCSAGSCPSNAALAVPVATVCGAALPGCECGSVPISNRLIERGVRPSASLAFMLSAPAINPIVLIATAVAFTSEPIDGVGQADRRPADRADRRLDLGADRPAGVDEAAGAGAAPTVSRAGGCSCPPSWATSPRPPGSW